MPYLDERAFNAPSGELNRAITKLFLDYSSEKTFANALADLIRKYEHEQKPRYATFNDIIGALECAFMELMRRKPGHSNFVEIEGAVRYVKHAYYELVVAPYEDKKITEFGDIYQELK